MLLERVLPLLKDGQVLVLHWCCRGVDSDCGTEAFRQPLCFTWKYVRIHLHCFTGNQYEVDRWLKEFPNTFFGFTKKITTFSPDQVEASKSLREDRLLLESDARYFSVGKAAYLYTEPSSCLCKGDGKVPGALKGQGVRTDRVKRPPCLRGGELKVHKAVAEPDAVFSIWLLANYILVGEFSPILSIVLVFLPRIRLVHYGVIHQRN